MFHIHWHKYVGDLGAWRYSECRCGSRKATRIPGLMGPPDREWLDGEREEFKGKKPLPLTIQGKGRKRT